MDICNVCRCRRDLNCSGRRIVLKDLFLDQETIWDNSEVIRHLNLDGNDFTAKDLYTFLPKKALATGTQYIVNITEHSEICGLRSIYPKNVKIIDDKCILKMDEVEAHGHEGLVGAVICLTIVILLLIAAVIYMAYR